MAYTAADVKNLRERTGAGMMDCKKALDESGGDFEAAVDALRAKGLAAAAKKSSRTAAEGLVGVAVSGTRGVAIEVNSETDFVAKSPDFLAFAAALAKLVVAKSPADVAALADLQIGGESVEATRQKLVQKIGENIAVRRFERIEAKGRLLDYVHPGAKVAVIVDYEGDPEVAKDLTHHIAFAKPKYMGKAELPADAIAAERKILEARAKESGKPPEIVAKMVDGGINKFIAENTLMGQAFVKDDKLTVEKMLAAKKTKLDGYRVLVVGEGIEKKQSDFAAEVASLVEKDGGAGAARTKNAA